MCPNIDRCINAKIMILSFFTRRRGMGFVFSEKLASTDKESIKLYHVNYVNKKLPIGFNIFINYCKS